MIVGVATEATEPPHAPTNASRASTTTATLRPAHSTLRPTFSATYRLLAGTHDAAHPTRHQQPHLSRAPAGHRSPTKPTLQRAPTTQPVRHASVQGMYRLRCATQHVVDPLLGRPASRPRKRGENPPSYHRLQARVSAGGRKVPEGALDLPLSIPHRYAS